ncbi:hypothetical protein C5167_005861 [Papaver somniferum]|uniref:Uncharacterized protein n=1 Tax=Papaver somniferum TaxID=3469 RepID=A0A4Y7JDF3_PAPSO|nr:hypothetical protein C5167_005861 [Papaver somniferum]
MREAITNKLQILAGQDYVELESSTANIRKLVEALTEILICGCFSQVKLITRLPCAVGGGPKKKKYTAESNTSDTTQEK